MKTERRHELQTNELAIWLKDFLEKIGPHRNLILGLVVIALAAVIVIAQLARRSEQKKATAWSSYFQAAESRETASFEKVANTFSGTKAGDWARQSAAISNLESGTRLAFSDKEASKKSLANAKEGFATVLKSSSDLILKKRALVGLAQAHEALGEFSDAIDSYKKVAEQYPDSVMSKMADEQIARLENPSTKAFQDWFEKQEPEKSPLNNPGLFDNMNNLPGDPDIDLPDPGDLLKADGESSDATDGGVAPFQLNSADGNADATETPADDPVVDTPSDDPAIETPSDETEPADPTESATDGESAADGQ